MTTPWDWQPAQASRIEQAVSLLRLEGADTRRFLHGQTSAAIETAPAGAWIPSCSISPTARMRALVEVLLDSSEGTPADSSASSKPGAWLVIHGIPPEAAEGVRQSLDRVLFPADQVQLGALETARLIIPVGPGTAQLPASPKDAWQALEAGASWLLGHQVLLRHGSEAPAWLAERALLSNADHERWRVQQAIKILARDIRRILALRDQVVRDGMQGPLGLTLCDKELGSITRRIAGQFLLLVNYNKQVFSEFYADSHPTTEQCSG